MADIRKMMHELVEQARALHTRERAISLESVLLIGRLDRGNSAVNLGLSAEAFARRVGLTPSMYFKRAQAARVIHRFPQAAAMVQSGETEISHLAAISTKITPANAGILLDGIKHKSKREVEQLLSIVTLDGRILDRESEVEIRVTLTKSQLVRLDRAREVLSHGGKVPRTAEVLMKAVEDLLERRDPLVKAERAGKRAAAKAAEMVVEGATVVEPTVGSEERQPAGCAAKQPESIAAPWQCERGGSRPERFSARRAAIPAAVHHAVMLRDQGRCQEILADGSRCPERHNVELDHIIPVCRGGQHTVGNLVLRCRRHNRHRVEVDLGGGYLVSWEQSRERAAYSATVDGPGLNGQSVNGAM